MNGFELVSDVLLVTHGEKAFNVVISLLPLIPPRGWAPNTRGISMGAGVPLWTDELGSKPSRKRRDL
jgi:hypothetical protein